MYKRYRLIVVQVLFKGKSPVHLHYTVHSRLSEYLVNSFISCDRIFGFVSKLMQDSKPMVLHFKKF